MATFTFDPAKSTYTGSSSAVDTLVFNITDADLSSTTLSSIEILKAASTAAATVFVVDQDDLAAKGTVLGGKAIDDVLEAAGTALDLTSTTLTSIEKLAAGSTLATTFTLDQADLAKNGSVLGNGGNDTLLTHGSVLNLTSTTLSSIEILKADGKTAATFTLDKADLTQQIIGSTAAGDTLIVKDTGFDLTSTTLAGVEILKAGAAGGTTFTLDAGDVGSQIIGSAGTDILKIGGTAFDLGNTTLSSIEKLQSNSTDSVTFTLDQADLAKNGSVIGGAGSADAISTHGTASLDLTSTTLTSIENLEIHGSTATDATFFTIAEIREDQFDGLTVSGSKSSLDALIVKTTDFDLTTHTVTGVEAIAAGLGKATTFTLNASDLASSKAGDVNLIVGGSGKDTLLVKGTDFNLAGVSVRGIEFLKADPANGTQGTTFTLSSGDQLAKSEIIGSTNATDTVAIAAFNGIDLSNTTLTSIEGIKLGASSNVGLTMAQFNKLGAVNVDGSGGTGNGVFFANTAIDLTSTTLNSIEKIAGLFNAATKIKLDLGDLATGGTVITGSGVDQLIVTGTEFDLSHTKAVSIEKLVADTPTGTDGTVFTLNQADLASKGSIIGTKNSDTVVAADTQLNLTSTTLSSIETLKAGTNATTFTVDQADLAKDGSVLGSGKDDTLLTHGSGLNLTSTTLSSIEILKADGKTAATFTLDKGDLASGGSVIGSTATGDTLIIKDTDFDLSSTTLTGIEILKAGATGATTFTLNADDIGTQVIGTAGIDTLKVVGTGGFDLSGTTLSSIEVLQAAAGGTQFTLNQSDLAKNGSVIGTSATNDQLHFVNSPVIDLTSTVLTNVDLVFSDSTPSLFKVDQADLSADFSAGATGSTIMIHGNSMDLTSTTLTFFDKIATDSAKGTTFKVDQADVKGLTVAGSTGVDTLVIHGTSLDLTSTGLSSIEKLGTDSASATTFKVDAADLLALGKSGLITGSAADGDTLLVHNDDMNLTNVTLNGIETLMLDSNGTKFVLDQSDIVSLGTSGSISGTNSGLLIHGTVMDLSSTTLTSVVTLGTDSLKATTFIVDQGDLASGGSVVGSKAVGDVLVAAGTALNLTSTTLDGIEILKAGTSFPTHFTLDQTDINTVTVVGGAGSDTLTAFNHVEDTIDLTHLKLTSIETIDTSTKSGTAHVEVGALGGVTLELGASSVGTDTITFDVHYKATTVTNIDQILAHTLTVDHFQDGATKGDVIELGLLVNGTVTTTSAVDVSKAADLKAALDLAAAGDGHTTSVVHTFDFGGDTYVVVDNSAGKAFSADDAVIKLVGSHTLTSDNFNFGI